MVRNNGDVMVVVEEENNRNVVVVVVGNFGMWCVVVLVAKTIEMWLWKNRNVLLVVVIVEK